MKFFILFLIASGIVGILCLALNWSISIGLIASGVAVGAFLIFYAICLIGRRSARKGNFALFLGEIAVTAVAVLITMFIGKFDVKHTLALIAPCLMIARIIGSAIAKEINEQNSYRY